MFINGGFSVFALVSCASAFRFTQFSRRGGGVEKIRKEMANSSKKILLKNSRGKDPVRFLNKDWLPLFKSFQWRPVLATYCLKKRMMDDYLMGKSRRNQNEASDYNFYFQTLSTPSLCTVRWKKRKLRRLKRSCTNSSKRLRNTKSLGVLCFRRTYPA